MDNNKEEVLHTAGEWKYIEGVSEVKIYSDLQVMPIAKCGHGQTVTVAEANAAFIVRACNSHYELLEALKGLYNLYQDGKLSELINDESETFSQVKIQMRLADLAIKKAESK